MQDVGKMEGKLHWVPLTLKVFTHKFAGGYIQLFSVCVNDRNILPKKEKLSASTKLGVSGTKCFTMTA